MLCFHSPKDHNPVLSVQYLEIVVSYIYLFFSFLVVNSLKASIAAVTPSLLETYVYCKCHTLIFL